ncbi:acyl carrier protein [Enterobacter kobei]|nr:acyl carrier protein [Enterobacter kobei]
MPPSLAEVIHLIRSRCDGAPGFITTETRLVSGLGFCSDDMEELLHEAEWHFGVRFPSDENALRELFSLRPHEYLLTAQESLPLSPAWVLCRLRGTPLPVQADISAGDFFRGLTALCLKGGEM